MNKKKSLAIASAAIIILSFLLFLFGEINYIVFLVVAILNAIFAYKVLPKMNN